MARLVRVAVPTLEAGELLLDASASHYLVNVHRLPAGARFVVFDPERALEADAELVTANERRAVCRVSPPRPARTLGMGSLTLLQGVGKADKMDQVVRDATALGVAEIVAVECARSVVRLRDSGRSRERAERWRKIAVESARQCGRGDIPRIGEPLGVEAALREHAATHALGWLCDPTASLSLHEALASFRPERKTLVFIGPEGGFDDRERALAREAGLTPVRLGPFTLRTETAALVVCAALYLRGTAPADLQ
jgi:16S rRNA (uracil1498-N3)-methyltransferase